MTASGAGSDHVSRAQSAGGCGAGSPVSGDPYVEAVDEVTSAADRLHKSVDRLVQQLAGARGQRLAGADMLDIVSLLVDAGWRDARRAPTADFKEFQQALTACRACAARGLVDDEGLSFTSVSLLTGVSRQMVARLYRAADGVASRRA
jgi:hypothetical protein